MSTDWNVHCVDCKSTHVFNDANHQDTLMALLCKHADAIADLAPLLREGAGQDIAIKTYWGDVDADWFARHRGHKLVPISEYGDLLAQGEHLERGVPTSAEEDPESGEEKHDEFEHASLL